MKKFLCLFIFITTLCFGKINDTLSLFTDDEKQKLNTQIEKIEEAREISIYVNTYSADEGFVIDKAQKVVVLNFIKKEDGNPKIEVKFSKDMEIDEETQTVIEDLLNENEKSIIEGKNLEYVSEMLNGIDTILENTKIEEPIVVEQELVHKEKIGFFIGMGIIFLIILGIIIRILMVKYNRSLKEEIDIISGDHQE